MLQIKLLKAGGNLKSGWSWTEEFSGYYQSRGDSKQKIGEPCLSTKVDM